MFDRHNAERAAQGGAALQVDAALVSIARSRANDMAANNYFAHTSPSGVTAFTLLAQAGYGYSIAGENIARNNYQPAQTVVTAMTGFMNSPGHRANLLDARYTRVGVGVVTGAGSMFYYAVVFAGK
jgi:uncharacterized protein YkwD